MVEEAQQREATSALTSQERDLLREALRVPRGRYTAKRAGQLSGVPERTVYHWARSEALVPDLADERPKGWSYRDLVYLRLTAWLRAHHVSLDQTVSLVRAWRTELEQAELGVDPTMISTDGVGIGIGRTFDVDLLTNQGVLPTMVELVQTFDLLAPVEVPELGRGRLWGPHLIRPSAETSMSPWVMRGEPVVRRSRLTTGAIFTLSRARRLAPSDIARLYPGVSETAIKDAIGLEAQLRRVA